MSKRELLLESTPQERVLISAKTLFFPVRLRLPDEVKDKMPASKSKPIDKLHVMRFYCTPSKGDIIEYKGFAWGVVGLYHTPLDKGSTGQDKCPQVLVEFIGAAS